jgi:hypothetical protein
VEVVVALFSTTNKFTVGIIHNDAGKNETN